MKEIPLTQGKVALVDDEDFEWLNQWKWFAVKSKTTFYASRNSPKKKGDKGSAIRMHGAIFPHAQGVDVDHVNGNGLDNRRGNLRLCSRSQNMANAKKARGSFSSKFKGVSRDKERMSWKASIRISYKHRVLGRFSNEEDAARAYDAAALKFFGEFARPNFPR